ncbi:hypothetical protein T05_937 [Trichinella murrelli]|uniref:Uncharacterized protein n=1 Tax=Trichinella murrelli TaxID=144512 RepID=A0A0V0UCK6_9BILA|nr:hypothetical protein T05_937 [Trichinella murrelli]
MNGVLEDMIDRVELTICNEILNLREDNSNEILIESAGQQNIFLNVIKKKMEQFDRQRQRPRCVGVVKRLYMVKLDAVDM